jgi:hypothetical protein
MSQEDPKEPTVGVADAAKQSLRKGVRQSVAAANSLLASLEKTTAKFNQPITNGLRAVEYESSIVASKAWHVYERRHEFGPHLVLGSAVLVGGVVGLRRGRLSAALSAAGTGTLTYIAIYEPIPLEEIPDLLFGKKD